MFKLGLRFRKSISIIPGVKLNFGKTGMSVSTGIPGFRKTFHMSGKVTTSVGIPGTGLYYVDTKNKRTQNNRRDTGERQEIQQHNTVQNTYCATENPTGDYQSSAQNDYEHNASLAPETFEQLDINSLKSIHKTSDDSIDWTEVLVSPVAPDKTYNQQMWEYYHNMAPKILAGDIDAYLKLIYEVNPLDDLLSYGGNFEFGTDNPRKIEVEFTLNEETLYSAKKRMNNIEYNTLLQDYVCSVCIRIARDMFALLPISNTIVHAVLNGITIISVDFDRPSLSKVKFGYIDPSDTLSRFKMNMNFTVNEGFGIVNRIE